jgi:glyoxylase-like metal-dependent hydrolase (beta-lactamase superfamily II)/ferredoxin
MANLSKRLETNVEGNFFVDSTCIDCDTCRQLAPTTFIEERDYSAVFHQPGTAKDELAAYQALIACPVGSIGTVTKNPKIFSKAQATFPLPLEDGVSYVGFNSEKSFGAHSYFILHPEGNWLIDSPRYLKHLVQSFEERGGIRCIFLSHQDDVADAARYAEKFGATRIIHRADASAMPDAEWVIDGKDALFVEPEFVFIPVPGHTAGSMALLYKNRFLFSGDHLWWDRDLQQLGTPENLVWDDAQLEQSVRTLLNYSFEWVLPGHGERIHLPCRDMKNAVEKLVQGRWNRKPSQP